MAHGGTFVQPAGERTPTGLFARGTRSIATLSVTRVSVAILQFPAFRLAQKLLLTLDFFSVEAAST